MITNLLIFFAIPLAVIVISIALQKILRNPFLVSAVIFSILLVIVLAFFDPIYLIAVLAYTILAFIAAVLTCLICRLLNNNNVMLSCLGCNNSNNNSDNQENLLVGESDGNKYNANSLGSTYYTGCYRKRY